MKRGFSMNKGAASSAVSGFVLSAAQVARDDWNDARGNVSFHTMVSAGATPSNSLTAGIAVVEPGGFLAKHRHAPAEIYCVLEGVATVTIDGVARLAGAGAVVFIPGDAWHAISNDFEKPFRFFYVFPADRFEDVAYLFAKDEG
jgi:quercetin dioxygenase-like cupin family protein